MLLLDEKKKNCNIDVIVTPGIIISTFCLLTLHRLKKSPDIYADFNYYSKQYCLNLKYFCLSEAHHITAGLQKYYTWLIKIHCTEFIWVKSWYHFHFLKQYMYTLKNMDYYYYWSNIETSIKIHFISNESDLYQT